MIVEAFLPIFLLLAVIIGLILLINKSSRFGFGRGRAGLWMLIGYSCLLVVSAVVFLALPIGNTDLQGKESERKEEQTSQAFYDAVLQGKINEMEKWLIHEWSFPFNEEQLILQVGANDVNSINIFVEHTDGLTDTIEASYYQTPLMIDGFEVEEKYTPAVHMDMTTLTIYPGETKDLKYKMFGSEFPFRMFNREEGTMWMDSIVSHWNGSALYIRVPEGLEVFADQSNYTEVDPS